jgi:hypothetical protein
VFSLPAWQCSCRFSVGWPLVGENLTLRETDVTDRLCAKNIYPKVPPPLMRVVKALALSERGVLSTPIYCCHPIADTVMHSRGGRQFPETTTSSISSHKQHRFFAQRNTQRLFLTLLESTVYLHLSFQAGSYAIMSSLKEDLTSKE